MLVGVRSVFYSNLKMISSRRRGVSRRRRKRRTRGRNKTGKDGTEKVSGVDEEQGHKIVGMTGNKKIVDL